MHSKPKVYSKFKNINQLKKSLEVNLTTTKFNDFKQFSSNNNQDTDFYPYFKSPQSNHLNRTYQPQSFTQKIEKSIKSKNSKDKERNLSQRCQTKKQIQFSEAINIRRTQTRKNSEQNQFKNAKLSKFNEVNTSFGKLNNDQKIQNTNYFKSKDLNDFAIHAKKNLFKIFQIVQQKMLSDLKNIHQKIADYQQRIRNIFNQITSLTNSINHFKYKIKQNKILTQLNSQLQIKIQSLERQAQSFKQTKQLDYLRFRINKLKQINNHQDQRKSSISQQKFEIQKKILINQNMELRKKNRQLQTINPTQKSITCNQNKKTFLKFPQSINYEALSHRNKNYESQQISQNYKKANGTKYGNSLSMKKVDQNEQKHKKYSKSHNKPGTKFNIDNIFCDQI